MNNMNTELLGRNLTTVLNYPNRGKYGDAKYRGNCSGYIQKSLFEFFQPKKVLDPFVGGGTTIDVCKEMAIDNLCLDLNPKYGGFNVLRDDIPESFDFVFSHDPYHDIISYSGNMWGEVHPDDLSRCKSYEEFISKINFAHARMFDSLRKGGHMAILTGDIKKRGVFKSLIKDMDWYGTPVQHIIKLQHNCFSSKTSYGKAKFIPIVHEHLLIFRKDDNYIIRCSLTKNIEFDSRKGGKATWLSVVVNAVQKLGGRATLDQLYREIDGHKKCESNLNWQAKIRQIVGQSKEFVRIGAGKYELIPFGI